MDKKLGPYVFIVILVIILTFIFGIRYGQRVEKDNKKVDSFLSQPPTLPTPTGVPLEFKTYTNKDCGISFLYPAFFKVDKEGSFAARLKNNKTFIIFDCHRNATSEPSISPNYTSLEKINPINSKKIYFTVEKSLQSLIEKSLEFTK